MCRFKSVKKLFCLCSAGFFAMLSLIAVIFAADIAVASADSYVANVAIFVAVDIQTAVRAGSILRDMRLSPLPTYPCARLP